MAKIKKPYVLLAWTVNIKTSYLLPKRKAFYFSLRPVNNPKNAKETSPMYQTAGGRNKALNKIVDLYGVNKVEVIRNCNPKQYLKTKKDLRK